MASAGSNGSAAASCADAGSVAGSVVNVSQAKGKAAGRARGSAQRPRLDIDDQIMEANRVHDMLKKMSSAAKQIKKSQTKAKQRLIKKASRLNPEDLERIAVLKRVFNDVEGDSTTTGSSSAASSSSTSAPAPNPIKGIRRLHSSLKLAMNKVPGAESVIESLGADLPSEVDTQSGEGGHVQAAKGACHEPLHDDQDHVSEESLLTSAQALDQE